MKPVYLDYNATTPIDPRVADSMIPYLYNHFGNPSSSHVFGAEAKKAVTRARKQVAEMLGCQVDEIIFTSGGSESNNLAIKGVAFAYRHRGNHIITSSIEHPAVLEVCHFLEENGFRVTYLPVDEYGRVSPKAVQNAITTQTILISVMHANNEIGTIQPLQEIAEIARKQQILFHSDCAQSVGKIPVRVSELGVNLLSIAGHKFYAPKGIGALYVQSGVKLAKLIHGADHERNLRAGTENVLEIVGLGKACELVSLELEKHATQLKQMRDRLENRLLERFPQARINGHPEKRLPNTLSISFPNLEANLILSELSGVAASAGAACHSDRVDVSHVLQALKIPTEYAMGTIRFSVGRFTTAEEIDKAVAEIENVVKRLLSRQAPLTIDVQTSQVKLTQFTHGLGCACKLRPQILEAVLRKLPVPADKNVIVGTETADDAAVYRIDDRTAIVQTVDFFTPIVDDPYLFGAIAAANSLSDIYAMGARPLFALNIVGFPGNRLSVSVLEQILQGAQEKAEEAGIAIIGGHTVDDTEPKFGLAVTGVAPIDRIVRNQGARPGDVLILTKPIGTGILSTALKQNLLDNKMVNELVRVMITLNKMAAEAMQEIGVNACTDVTGFGLLGHLLEMVQASQVSAMVESQSVPILPEVYDLAAAGVIPGGTQDNFSFTHPFVDYDAKISETQRLILNDAQTSGGLLMAVPEKKAETLLEKLQTQSNMAVAVIGRIVQRAEKPIRVCS
ncbi:MAG: hypothetical protein Kow0042_22470 [Calditrichia bacterium]